MSARFDPEDHGVVFELADRGRRLASVQLQQELGLPGPIRFDRMPGGWRTSIERPDVDRMEYLFDVEDHNGRRHTVLDPGNPERVGGAFGDKSVLEFPEYEPPAWLTTDPVAGAETAVEVPAASLDEPITGSLWAPADLAEDEPAPLIVVHDGPEYAKLGDLTRYLGAMVASGELPPVRALLLDPGDRNAWYAANADYAAALAGEVLAGYRPADGPQPDGVRHADGAPQPDGAPTTVPTTGRIGVGVSLGALAMLHAHVSHAGAFDALLLQSGSYFTTDLDPQESHFGGFAAVSDFVHAVAAGEQRGTPVPTVITCGTVEENLANNRAMAEALRGYGYPVTEQVVRDAHNFTAWRDALHPHLADLIRTVAGAA